MLDRRTTLKRDHQKLLDRAVRSGLLPPTGLTPREQFAHLARTAPGAPRDLQRLNHLIERCLYDRAGTAADIEEALELTRVLHQRLPEPPSLPAPSRIGSWLLRSGVIARHLAPWIVGITLIAATGMAMRSCTTTGLRATSNPGWQAAIAAERTAASNQEANWVTAPRNATWNALALPAVIDEESLAESRNPGFDLDTGSDGHFPDAVDPFDPPLFWTHRLNVFTQVDAGYRFHVVGNPHRDATGRRTLARYRHTATVDVNLIVGRPIPIPISAPDAVVESWSASPPQNVRFLKDSADALYAVGTQTGRTRLRYILATDVDYHSGPLPTTPFTPRPHALPPNVQHDAARVIDQIGDLPQPTYRGTVRRLHRYFAGFTVRPIAGQTSYGNDYLDVALNRAGVCRHRARSFFITANAVGVETRLVENGAHSFCEVRLPDGQWRRMEFRLGEFDGPPAPRLAGGSLGGGYTVGYVAFYASMIILVLAAAGIIRRALDLRGHRITPPTRHATLPRRVRRSVRSHALAADAEALISAVRRRAADVLGAPSDDPAEIAAVADAVHLPPLTRARLRHVLEYTADQPTRYIDTRALERVFWNCFYLIRWFDRGDAGDRSIPDPAAH